MRISVGLIVVVSLLGCSQGAAQKASPAAASQSASTPAANTPPAPATKLEAFKPSAGTLVTKGFNKIGHLRGVAVDAREFKTAGGTTVRGVVVEVHESEYREERAFIDTDELPELLKGIDALLAIKSNPTSFENFEVQYTTKGELRLIAFSSSGTISYAVQAGRITTASSFMDQDGLSKLRGMFEAASQQLAKP